MKKTTTGKIEMMENIVVNDYFRIWLSLMLLHGGGKLLGEDIEKLRFLQGRYLALAEQKSIGIECPLMGRPESDFGIAMRLGTFFDRPEESLKYGWERSVKVYDEMFMAKRVKDARIFLEIDASRESEEASCFFHLDVADESLTVLNWQEMKVLKLANLERYQDSLQRVKERLQGLGRFVYFGCMSGRAGSPMKLVMQVEEKNMEAVFDSLSAVIKEAFVDGARSFLPELKKIGNWHKFMISVDIFPDGSFGPRLGLEVANSDKTDFDGHKKWLKSEQYNSLCRLMQAEGVADDRIELVAGLCERRWLDGEHGFESYLSHYKLVWEDGQAQPAKVYLQLGWY